MNNWHHLAGIISAKFQLVNASVDKVNRKAEKGDYFQIDIPGPGSMKVMDTTGFVIIDRNIKPNDDVGLLTDKIRDIAVGIGAIGLFSKVKWQGLAKGLVKKEK